MADLISCQRLNDKQLTDKNYSLYILEKRVHLNLHEVNEIKKSSRGKWNKETKEWYK